jgi:hypothetical protein
MGLMDYKSRFYSPMLGRFIQPDNIIPGAGNPQSWNRFSYVWNNPINFNDPTGYAGDGNNPCGVLGDQCAIQALLIYPSPPILGQVIMTI